MSIVTPTPTPVPSTVWFSRGADALPRGNQSWGGFCCSLGQGGEISSSCLLPRRPQVPRFKNHSQNVFLFPELKLIAELPHGLKNGVEQAVVLRSGFRMHVTRLALWAVSWGQGPSPPAGSHPQATRPVPPGDHCRPPTRICCPWDKKPGLRAAHPVRWPQGSLDHWHAPPQVWMSEGRAPVSDFPDPPPSHSLWPSRAQGW